MSRKCPRCGVKYKSKATHCVLCNIELPDNHIYAAKKMILIGFVAAFVLAAVIIWSVMVFTGPKMKAKKVIEGYIQNDFDAVVEAYPSFLLESDRIDLDLLLKDQKDHIDYMSEYILPSYKIKNPERPTSKEIKELIMTFRIVGGSAFDEDKLQDIRIVWIHYDDDLWDNRAVRFIMIKYDGKWCWWPETVGR